MSNPSPGEIVYTIQKIYGAQLDTQTNVYGTPFTIDYVQDGDVNHNHDTDEIKAGGMIRELLSVHVGSEVSFTEAWLPADAVTAITGETESQSGDSGNRVWTRDMSGAGEGNPYVGIILVFAALGAARKVIGLAKCQADKKQQFQAQQNQFRTGELKFMVASATANTNLIVRGRRYEAVGDVPDFTQQANFQSYFDGFFS